MESGSRNGPHTNHDRDPILNGTHGMSSAPEAPYDSGKPGVEIQSSLKEAQVANGINGALPEATAPGQALTAEAIPLDVAKRVQQLPPEIIHITEGFELLSKLLMRMAQVTHNKLVAKITELAAMPIPSSAANGNSIHYANGTDDNSVDNIKKKVNLLKFAEEIHANWTKALVITHWSRVSEDVSKVIDLKVHLDNQRRLYDAAVYDLSEVKRSLVHARVPNPDLRTALEILSTGKASWIPDPVYIEPPLLTAKEILKSLKDLNTLLSIRLNLYEYDKIPFHFKDYRIRSGRVTFRVAGEFEVDLTIADEDPESQFWFIDFRFLFTPVISDLPEQYRPAIENRVNIVLKADGLAGCYRFLHELVLTHKISEIRRQAIELSRGRWIETLQVEPLHRALSIQYWVDRYGKDGPRSWIILGVSSGKRGDGRPDPKATSHISLRWFRDSKEVKDHDIPLELTTISSESLLRTVISKHIFHILRSTHKNLSVKPLFFSRQLSISFKVPGAERIDPELEVQLIRRGNIKITIEPMTGRFSISPACKLTASAEWRLNSQIKDPAANAHEAIENLRCFAATEEVVNRALTVGWVPVKNPGLKQEDLRLVVPRDTLHVSWFRRAGWKQTWVIALSSGMSGERWWLMEIINGPQGLNINSHLQIPLGTTSLHHTYAFLSALHLFTAALITYHSNLRALHSRQALYSLQDRPTKAISSTMKFPAIFVKLSDILPSKNKTPRTGKAWAKDVIRITFQGLQSRPKPSSSTNDPPASQSETPARFATLQAASGGSMIRELDSIDENAIVVAEACLMKPMPPSLNLVKQRVDKDIVFHPTSGGLAFRLYAKVGDAIVNPLVERLQRVEQLVDFVEVAKKHEKTLHCETVSLSQIIFSYCHTPSANTEGNDPDAMAIDRQSSKHRAFIDFSNAHSPMKMILEPGNPQIRILDHLTKTLNSAVGLNGVATLLPLTLPLMMAFDAIEDAWTPLTDLGDVIIFNRAMDWHIVRYNLTPDSPEQKARKIMLEIRLQHRRGSPWWCIRREKERDRSERRNSNSGDEIDTVLKTVWEDNAEGQDWRGMSTSGIARVEGVEELVRRVDDVIRGFAAKNVSNAAVELKEIQQPTVQREDNRQPARPQVQREDRTRTNHGTIIIN